MLKKNPFSGSATLHLRLLAFGKLCTCFVCIGIEPVTAVVLALAITTVLAVL